MKTFFIIIVFFSFTLGAFGQQDSGFTNKMEAKNLMVNGKKEGKWMEYMDDNNKIAKDSSARYYHLAVYKSGRLNGVVREYEKNGQLHCTGFYINNKENGDFKFYNSGHIDLLIPYVNGKENGVAKFYPAPGDTDSFDGIMEIPYLDGKKNGVEKGYYKSGKIKWEDTINNGKKQGIDIVYYESGKIKSETFYKKGKEISSKKYDENGSEIK